MAKPDWTQRTYEFSWLKGYAAQFNHTKSIVHWLKIIGVIPNDVEGVRPTQVRLELDPNAIPGGYLASVAYEWDSWGESSPLQFLRALRCETQGTEERDSISSLLVALGRAPLDDQWT